MQAAFKTLGWLFWALCMVVVMPFILMALGLFWLANGGFKELEGY